MNCGKANLMSILQGMVQTIAENEQHLNQLDSVIGDAEHGSNLKQAFEKALCKVETLNVEQPEELLTEFGKAVAGSGCGSGPLFIGLAIKAAGRYLLQSGLQNPSSIKEALRAALEAVKEKGGAQVGDKTLVDALEPAVQAFEKALQSGQSLAEAFAQAREAAREGMLSTKDLAGKRGRASYLGERGVGYQDPGATSIYLLLESLYQSLTRKESNL